MSIELSKEAALVLFELLSRIPDQDLENLLEDEAELIALWQLQARLEKQLTEPFDPNYRQILQQARKKLRGE